MRWSWWVLAAGLVAAQAQAQTRKDFCADRPGRSDATCTLDAGTVQIETSLTDWSHSRDSDAIEDQILVNDMLLRAGLTRSTELQFGWTMLGVNRTRDRANGTLDRRTGTGDVTLGIRQSLRDGGPGKGMSISLQPSVSLPSGRTPIGAGTWGAGVVLPAQIFFSKTWSLTLDPEVDAAPNEDGSGRHLAYAMVANLRWKATKTLQIAGETYVERDRDPAAHETKASLDATAAYQIGKNSQVDVAAYAGLNAATARIQLLLGWAHRF
jgi:hypothetical protein